MDELELGLNRLERLAQILEQADALHLERKEPLYNQTKLLHRCGTPACALGHYAAATPERWKFERGECLLKEAPYLHPFEAAKQEFAISWQEAEELFEYDGCGDAKTAKQAAAYIREFVSEKRHQLKREAP